MHHHRAALHFSRADYPCTASCTVLCPQVAGNFHFAPGRSYQQGSMHIHDL